MGKKKRLIDLDVDEVSLVDKPAIGETVYLTKRAKGKATMTTKTKKEPKKKEEGGNTEPAATTEPAKTDDATALEKRFSRIEKGLADVETMLQQSLDLHESVVLHLNEMLSLNLGALDAVMMLMEENTDETEAPADGATENQTMSQRITEIRESVKAVRQEVLKAGAKMSRTRLQALRDIAAKLTELITSVEPPQGDDKEASAGGKKKAALLSVTKQFKASLETVTAEIGECMNANGELKKAVAGMEERLKGLEETAGASDAIGDDDDSTGDGDKSKSAKEKSVFHGLIPVDQIRESHRKRVDAAKK